MDFLVLSPPVSTPAEPPSGAFLLAAGLAGHGHHTGFLDLSLEFYHRVLDDQEIPGPSVQKALCYLQTSTDGYLPLQHRSLTGVIHKKLRGFSRRYPGWKLTSMDLGFPGGIHDPEAMAQILKSEQSPFRAIWETVLLPHLARLKPRRILVSLAYLSQLIATIDLTRFLAEKGYQVTIGGSLPRSLAETGLGLKSLGHVFEHIELGDGMALISRQENHHLLEHLHWPEIVSSKAYLSARPIIPLTLSTGCFWSRCLFCPDRGLPFIPVPISALEEFFVSVPREIHQKKPVIHLLDSAMPPRLLRNFLPLAKQTSVGFYGFARPTRHLLHNHLLDEAAESGLKMLQLGAESGSGDLLKLYKKGIEPGEAAGVVRHAAELGIRTYLYLLFGLPAETAEDRNATKKFVSENADSIDFLNLSLFNLPRYCELTERADQFQIDLSDFPDDNGIRLYWPFTYRGTSPRDDARQFLLKKFNQDPAIHPAVLRTPRWFRAAHLALMKIEGRQDP